MSFGRPTKEQIAETLRTNLESFKDSPMLFKTYRNLLLCPELTREPGGWVYRGRFYPDYLMVGGASLAIHGKALRYCRGNGVDIGAGLWPLPGSYPIDNEQGPGKGRSLAEVLEHSLDYVFSSHCLEHIRTWERELEIWRGKLKIGGILFLYLPHWECEIWHPGSPFVGDGHVWIPTMDVLEKTLRRMGFDIVENDPGPDAMQSFHIVARKADLVPRDASAHAPVPDAELYRPQFEPWQNMKSEFQKMYAKTRPYSLIGRERSYVLYRLACQAARLPGEFWECGVYRGGSAILVSEVLAASGTDPDKRLHLFDTFGGMPQPRAGVDTHQAGDYADTSVEFVRSIIPRRDRVEFHPGLMPDTFAGLEGSRIAFAHIDVDIYPSVLACCRFIYPRMVQGGFIIFDDYGFDTCPGARKAVDEFFADKPESPLVLRSGQAVVFAFGSGQGLDHA